jgi:hypothetical protein
MSPNEIRELENRNRVDGLDEISQIPQGAAPGKPQQQQQPPSQNQDDNQVVQPRAIRRSVVTISAGGTSRSTPQ